MNRGGKRAHPNMDRAVAECQAGNDTYSAIAKKYGIKYYTLKSAIYRKQIDAAAKNRAYEKTKNGFLVRTYRNMLSRVSGIHRKKAHIYAGLPILTKENFYAWAKADKDFHRIFEKWEQSGYERRLSPSVNRIDSRKGYLLENIEWLENGINSSLGASNGRTQLRNKNAQLIAIKRAVGVA